LFFVNGRTPVMPTIDWYMISDRQRKNVRELNEQIYNKGNATKIVRFIGLGDGTRSKKNQRL